MSSVLFTNVNILDGNAPGPVSGEVIVADGRITAVESGQGNLPTASHRVVDGKGRTLMSGLCDAHTSPGTAAATSTPSARCSSRST